MVDGTTKDLVGLTNTASGNALTPAQFGALAEMPAELEWLANITNPKTRRAYKIDVEEFIGFAGLRGLSELRSITRAHVIAWRKDLEKRELADATIRRQALGCLRPVRLSLRAQRRRRQPGLRCEATSR